MYGSLAKAMVGDLCVAVGVVFLVLVPLAAWGAIDLVWRLVAWARS